MKNKKLIRPLLFVMMTFCFVNGLKAQDSLVVYDVIGTLTPVIKIQSLVHDSIVNSPQPVDTAIHFNVILKLNDVSLADIVLFKLGSTKDGAEILNSQANVIKTSNNYYLTYSQNTTQVYNNSCVIQLLLSRTQYNQLKWLTVFSKDKNGAYSGKKFYQVNY